MSIGILLEHLESVYHVGACNDITAHADAQALTQPCSSDGGDCFIRESARLCYNADVSWCECWKRLEAYSAVPNGCDYARRVGAHEAGLGLRFEDARYL